MTTGLNESHTVRIADRLLDKRDLKARTSLDISTIYRKMKAGTFPQPVRIGRRRVAWRESDVAEWQHNLEVGTRFPSEALVSRYQRLREKPHRTEPGGRDHPNRSAQHREGARRGSSPRHQTAPLRK